MKKISIICTLALLVMASCSREQEMNDKIDPTSGEEPQGGVIFTATLEETGSASDGDDEDGTRTSISGTKVLWNKGDAVKIFWNGGSVTATALQSGSTTDFSAAVDLTASAWYAVYPASLTASLSGSTLSVTVPAAQSGLFEDANIMVAKTTGTNLAFKNLCGLMKFTISNTAVRTIIIRGMAGEALAGTLPVTFDGSNVPVPGEATSTETAITLTVSGAGTYYVALLPGTALGSGFYFEMKDGEGNPLSGAIGGNAVTINRSYIVNLGSLDGKLWVNRFVTPSGAGDRDGSTWENAFSFADFLTQVSEAEVYSESDFPHAAKIARLSGSTFHFKEGTYTAAATALVAFDGCGKAVPINILGGYPASLSGTELSGRAAPSSPLNPTTVFTTADASTFQLFRISKWAQMTWDGIKVQDVSYSVSDYGGAIALIGPTANQPASLTCRNCLFTGNNVINKSGGAFYVNNARFLAENCEFIGNYTTRTEGDWIEAGAINILGASHCTLSGCRFDGNHAYRMGGAVYIDSLSGEVSMTDCSFTGNYVIESGNWGFQGGGAVAVWEKGSSSGTISMERCNFTANYADNCFGGAVFLSGETVIPAKMYAKDCVFTGNHSNGYGGAWCGGGRKWSSSYSLTLRRTYMDGCKFSGNYVKSKSAPQGYGHAIGYNQGWLAMNNCAFWDNGNNAAAGTRVCDIFFEANTQYMRPKAVLLMVNTTVVSHSNAESAVQFYKGDAYINIINSLLVSPANAIGKGLDTPPDNCIVYEPTSGQYTVLSDNGSSAFYTGQCSGCQAVALGDYATWKAKFTDGYKYDGSGLGLAAYVTSAQTLSDFCSAIDASAVAYDLGPELAAFARFGQDIDGKTRTGNFTPGCWQLK